MYDLLTSTYHFGKREIIWPKLESPICAKLSSPCRESKAHACRLPHARPWCVADDGVCLWFRDVGGTQLRLLRCVSISDVVLCIATAGTVNKKYFGG